MLINEDLTNMLWIGAFRYYCGRTTISVHAFCEELIKEWVNIPNGAQGVIKRDLEEAIRDDDRDRERGSEHFILGHDSDKAKWLDVFTAIS